MAKKMGGKGQKVIRHPRIEAIIDKFTLDGKTADHISEILSRDFNFKITANTIRSYLKNYCQRVTPEAQIQLNTLFKALIASKREITNKYIEDTEFYLEYLQNTLNQINKETWLMSTEQKMGTTAQGALAIVALTKLMMGIREQVEEVKHDTGMNQKQVVDKVLLTVTKVFFDKIFIFIPEDKQKKVKEILQKELETLEHELCDVPISYRVL